MLLDCWSEYKYVVGHLAQMDACSPAPLAPLSSSEARPAIGSQAVPFVYLDYTTVTPAYPGDLIQSAAGNLA